MLKALLMVAGLSACGEPIRDFLGEQGTGPMVLFLNTEPTVFAPAGNDATQNLSTVVGGQVQIRGYMTGAPDRAAVIAELRDEVAAILAPYAVNVVTVRPASGRYHMVMLTDDTGISAGCSNCISAAPPLCDGSVDAAVGFLYGGVFGGGISTPKHLATNQIIAMFGQFIGIPTSNLVGDCMCYVETPCIEAQQTMNAACTIGGAGTLVSGTQACPTELTSMDEHAEFLDALGPAFE